MRYFITLFLVIAVAGWAQATPPSDASLDQLMDAMQLETLLNQALKEMNQGMAQGMEQGLEKSIKGQELNANQKAAVEKFRTQFDKTVKDELSYPKVKQIYIQAYKDTFTQEEVDAITVFYKSPAGKAITTKYPLAMQKANSLMQSRIGPLTTKLQAMLNDFVTALAKTK